MMAEERTNVLGFDFGLARIGVALLNLQASIVHPLSTIHYTNTDIGYAQINELLEQWKPQRIIIGYPDENSPAELLSAINQFIVYLKQLGLAVEKVDEAYTSIAAKEIIKQQRQQNLRSKTEKGDVDQIAACLILESWLTQQTEKTLHGKR